MAKPLFRIFVSSTYRDLIDYRKAAKNAINGRQQKFVGMEHIGARNEEPLTASLEMIDECDLFIGIYAWRYGTVPPKAKYSIIEEEYRYAQALGRPCLCYVVDKEFPWIPTFIDDGSSKKKLEKFKKNISEKHVRDTFKEPHTLENSILRDLSNWLSDNRPDLKPDAVKPGQDPLKAYNKAIAKRFATLPMIGFKRSFDMDDIYIPLTVHADPESKIRSHTEVPREKFTAGSLTAEDLLKLPYMSMVVLGEPGMGKTTMLHYLALRESKKSANLLPILVKLSDFGKTRAPLGNYLLNAVENFVPGETMRDKARAIVQQEKALVLLDGLDEVSRDNYSSVTERIRAFIAAHDNCRVIITSRKAGFHSNAVPYSIFEIDRLPFSEIDVFVKKWFAKKNNLAERIRGNPRIYELAENPFLLSIICIIFEKDQTLPQRRLELYQTCATTLLTLYDQRKIDKVNGFSCYLKERVLEDLAHHFFVLEKNEFPSKPLSERVRKTLNDLDKGANEDKVLEEIRENSGLLQKSDNEHLFVHRTFFEYYVACKMSGDSADSILQRAEEPRWEEPLRLYAAQIESISDGTAFLKKLWEKDQALALRCYPDMDQVVEPELIKNLLHKADVEARVALVKGLPERISEPDKVVETLRELFRWESNGEVIYWGVQILEERKDVPGAVEVVRQKLDDGAKERYEKYLAEDMVLIPAGEFQMGSPESEKQRGDDEILHPVKLSEFYMSCHPVTNWLYEEFDPAHRERRDQYSEQDDQPVIYVNWYEAVIFSRWLGCRLPGEAQWEYACRAGTSTPFSTGENLTTDQANYDGNYPYGNNPKGKYLQKTAPVGSYTPNPWGLCDMHGNVYDWCADWYDGKYYEECKQKGTVENPAGPPTGSLRVLRGGGWFNDAQDCRSAYRIPDDPDFRGYFGFRLVFVP